MRRSPEVLALSSQMEKPAGRRAAFWAVSIAPSLGTVFTLAGLNQYAMKAVAVGIIFQAVAIGATFWVGGRSLVGAINESLRQHQQQRRETVTVLTAATAVTGTTRGGADENDQDGGDVSGDNFVPGAGDQPLLAAKKKIKRMTIFALQNVVVVMSMLLVTVFTDYGVAAPLLLYMTPSESVHNLLLKCVHAVVAPDSDSSENPAWTSFLLCKWYREVVMKLRPMHPQRRTIAECSV